MITENRLKPLFVKALVVTDGEFETLIKVGRSASKPLLAIANQHLRGLAQISEAIEAREKYADLLEKTKAMQREYDILKEENETMKRASRGA